MRIDPNLLRSDERSLLSEMARRLIPHLDDIIADWTERWVAAVPVDNADPQAYRQMVSYTLDLSLRTTLENVAAGRFEECYEFQYQSNRTYTQTQTPSSEMPVFTQADMQKVSSLGRPVLERWIENVFLDEPERALRAMLAQERFGGQLSAILSEAYADEREARLRVISDRLERALAESEQFRKLAQAINQSLDLNPVLDLTLRTAVQLLGADSASLSLLDRDGARLHVRHAEGAGSSDRWIPIAGTLQAWVLQHGRATKVPPLPDGVSADIEAGATMLTVPLLALRKPLGTLSVTRRSGRWFSARSEALLSGLAETVTTAIANARAHSAVRTALTSAEEANRAKSEFVAAVVHEVRSPLNALVGYVDLLAEGAFGSVDEEQRRILGRVGDISRSTIALTNDLLDHARVEAGLFPINLTAVPLRSVLDEIAAVATPLLQGKTVTLGTSIANGADAVQADPVRLRQVLTNLVTNAVKFTAHGRIDLRAEAVENRVHLRVADTGIGIRAEVLQRLFTLFYRGEEHSGVAGAGIGLFLSRRLAELMGGELSVESELGRGSTFTLTLSKPPAA